MAGSLVAIVQARMGSSRLPGKVLLPVAGEPILGCIVDRLSLIEAIDSVLVATSSRELDDPVADYCAGRDIRYFRGSEEDVLDRFAADIIHFVGKDQMVLGDHGRLNVVADHPVASGARRHGQRVVVRQRDLLIGLLQHPTFHLLLGAVSPR